MQVVRMMSLANNVLIGFLQVGGGCQALRRPLFEVPIVGPLPEDLAFIP